MKRILFPIITILALVSCGNNNENPSENIVDYAAINFQFDVTNSAGESLIDSLSPAYDADFVANTYIIFQGKEYKMGVDAKDKIQPSSRYFYDTFHGIIIQTQTAYDTKETKTLARIGSFLSDYDWKSEEIDIHWGDNSEDKIVFTSVITSIGDNLFPEWSKKYLFNGADYTETFYKPYGYMKLVKNTNK